MVGKKFSVHLRKSIISLVSIIIVLVLAPGINVNARHHTRVKYKRTHRIIHKRRRKGNYLIGNLRRPVYILNWNDIKHFRAYRGAFKAKDDVYDLPVKVTSRVRVGDSTFNKVRFSRRFKKLDGWVYSKSLSHNPKRGMYFKFNNLIKNTLNSEIDHVAPVDLVQMKNQTFKDLNLDRNQHHVSSLNFDDQLNALAKLRARQISTNFSHYDQNGIPYTTDDASLVNLPNHFQASENIASAGLGNNTLKGDYRHYYNRNGNDMANTDNNGMMYHDQAEHNGHRYNILDPNSTLVGIGTSYNPNTRSFFVAEDFGNHDPQSSEDVD